MLEKFQQHIASQFSFLEKKKLLIAISGGVDSVVLTHLLQQLQFDIALAHCNFKLRGEESNIDETFVSVLGKNANLETFTISFDTENYAKQKQLSTQVAARELRYQWFDALAKEHQFDYVLTAHHADDNLETFLINLSRGTGLEGLTGIPAINNNIVRPLLVFSRDEIVTYAMRNNIEWREDASNTSTKYVRNKIRLQIVPILKEINPNLLDSFLKTTTHLQGSQQIIKNTIDDLKKKSISEVENGTLQIDISKIQQLSNPKAYLFEILKEYGFSEWNDVVNLLDAQSGKQVVSKTHRLIKDREFLLLSRIQSNNSQSFSIPENTSEITNPIHLSFEKVSESTTENRQTIYVDAGKITFPLSLRKWQHGDVFYPKGMQGKKKVAKYFKDEKFSLLEKENTWILCSKEDILWIVGHRQDNRFTIDSKTISLIKISI